MIPIISDSIRDQHRATLLEQCESDHQICDIIRLIDSDSILNCSIIPAQAVAILLTTDLGNYTVRMDRGKYRIVWRAADGPLYVAMLETIRSRPSYCDAPFNLNPFRSRLSIAPMTVRCGYKAAIREHPQQQRSLELLYQVFPQIFAGYVYIAQLDSTYSTTVNFYTDQYNLTIYSSNHAAIRDLKSRAMFDYNPDALWEQLFQSDSRSISVQSLLDSKLT